jgi:cytochrome c-type protein NapC
MTDVKPGWVRRTWGALRRPSVKYSVMSLLAVGFIGGILFWGGYNTGMDATNRLEFCISCHEMRDNVYQEYKQTIHYTNRTGVRAICSDCHVPKSWTHKFVRKIKASAEVWGKLTGSIDTKEKFEARRMALAQNEWKTMKETDSRECRNCHAFTAMDSKRQKPRAQKNHEEAQQNGKTCIDCHKGIAHLLPREYAEDDE